MSVARATEECEQDQNAEQAADHDRIADVFHGGADKGGLVIDHLGTDVRGQALPGQQVANAVGDVDRVAAQATKDGDDHGVAALETDGEHPVLVHYLHVRHIAHQ